MRRGAALHWAGAAAVALVAACAAALAVWLAVWLLRSLVGAFA